MKFPFILIVILATTSCQDKKEKTETKPATSSQTFYVGTYTDVDSEGIYKYALDSAGSLSKVGLMAKTSNPSFVALTPDKKYLLAVNEAGEGTVESYAVHPDSLELLSQSKSGGAAPCFVNVDNEGNVLVANYNGGNVGLLNLQNDGKLSDLLNVSQHEGSDITDRQKGPHAHSAWFAPDKNTIISADLGTNQLWFSKIEDQKLVNTPPDTLGMEPGAGPRHLAFHPNKKWIYVISELNNSVTQIVKDSDSSYTRKNSYSTLPEDFTGESACADIHISSDGKFVYASNRGHNSITVFEVNNEDGSLAPIQYESVHGNWPRNFALSPNEDYVIVANRKSNNITSFKRDKTTGKIDFVGEVDAPSPVCILFD